VANTEGSLSDRLKSLGVQLGARDLPPPRPRLRYPIEQVLSGIFRTTASGDVFVVETDYAPDYRHGSCSLQISAPLDAVARWARDPRVARLDGAGFAFLDTETTGLAGGTGTYPFLVGLGHYVDQGFRVAQFFMREPVEEAALLEALTESLSPHMALVTFNGKAFDAPLLNTRYVMGGVASPLINLAHVDLLPLARRLWRGRLPSRALGALETHILGAARTQHDVPGWLIPGLYFDYLRSGDARPLRGVFYHNAMDISALAALLNHVAHLLADPLHAGIEHGLDLIDLGCLFEDLGESQTAVQLYRSGLEHDLPAESREQTMRRLALLLRRCGCVDEAVAVWQQAAGAQHVYAHVELAKHCEHKLRDYEQAAHWTQTAIDLVTASGLTRRERARWLAELTHRLSRLQRKISRTQIGIP
jgi:uncharacterized protein YprB with RNaseH-like and TPR domain